MRQGYPVLVMSISGFAPFRGVVPVTLMFQGWEIPIFFSF